MKSDKYGPRVCEICGKSYIPGRKDQRRDMTLETALMLVCGIAEKYWREPDLEITIRREPICEGCEDARERSE